MDVKIPIQECFDSKLGSWKSLRDSSALESTDSLTENVWECILFLDNFGFLIFQIV